ncbi:hypothetical protein J3R82DRAFT_2308, partial [Butyriboletus roseoflavus]
LWSSVLESLLLLPYQHDNSTEGTCDKNPIILHDIVCHEFNYILIFLSGGYAGEQYHKEYLMSVLMLLAFFKNSHGYKYAIAELRHLSILTSSLKLQLGCQYHVDKWVESAFQNLM